MPLWAAQLTVAPLAAAFRMGTAAIQHGSTPVFLGALTIVASWTLFGRAVLGRRQRFAGRPPERSWPAVLALWTLGVGLPYVIVATCVEGWGYAPLTGFAATGLITAASLIGLGIGSRHPSTNSPDRKGGNANLPTHYPKHHSATPQPHSPDRKGGCADLPTHYPKHHSAPPKK